jgi:hypothetical protein
MTTVLDIAPSRPTAPLASATPALQTWYSAVSKLVDTFRPARAGRCGSDRCSRLWCASGHASYDVYGATARVRRIRIGDLRWTQWLEAPMFCSRSNSLCRSSRKFRADPRSHSVSGSLQPWSKRPLVRGYARQRPPTAKTQPSLATQTECRSSVATLPVSRRCQVSSRRV